MKAKWSLALIFELRLTFLFPPSVKGKINTYQAFSFVKLELKCIYRDIGKKRRPNTQVGW